MREILFRGRRLEGGSWGEGYFAQTEAASYIWDERSCEWLDVDPETVGQYTGLTDKDGRKIFEGDILMREDGTKHIVEYHHDQFWNKMIQPKTLWMEPIAEWDSKVIGNIYDNPELLEAEP